MTSQKSTHSITRSQVVAGGAHDSDVPLDSIKVSQGLEIQIEERDDLSQKSYTSTNNLTSLPAAKQPGWREKNEWIEGCRTVCEALKPGSLGTSRSRSLERDVESGGSDH